MKAYTQGNLCAIWRDGDEPQVDEALVRQIYDNVFKPALQSDIIRLHQVMVGSFQKTRPIGFDEYLSGLMAFKKSVGELALMDLGIIEAGLEAIHADYMSKRLYGFKIAGQNVVRRQEDKTLDASEVDYLGTRFQCVGYDTSAALRDIGRRFSSERGREAMYIATLQGGDSLDALLTEQWVNDRRDADMGNLRRSLLDSTASQKLSERLVIAARARKQEPVDDITGAIRVANLHSIQGGRTFRAA